ncbi:hypothetical protein AWJ20_4582 [Sugiyamaella lignohabitans]|uniref:Phospholipid/glycerol acyltransferase domain-containing protein n=1 Tax=Sugiyamaella lignohabitans TaxID=796027 RepID=A0A167CIX8_9ASCO|nr:uncharacterized protein AWJ20_4582 [Sugiyamaella lignohabitans]ANB11760.1 hypothetical protein AWJ20_4582 [Sugiyamaella lignohabitans]
MVDVDILDSTGHNEAPSDNKEEMNIVSDMIRFRKDPVQFMKNLNQHIAGSSWRGYDEYFGHPLYYPEVTEDVINRTLHHPVLQKRIKDLVEIRMQKEQSWILTANQRLARKEEFTSWITYIAEGLIAKGIATYDHKSILKFMYFVVGQIFARCYHQGVHINSEEVARIRAKAKELQAKKQSLVFLPCHKSHFDYMAMQFICFRIGLSLPVVVAGENLNLPILGYMLQQVGAMFIRRGNWSQDYLYQGVVQSYLETILKEGYNLQCFIEGTRSRSGKLLPPKFGILKYILDSILNGHIQDTWICPVSTQYDKVVEANSYATELLGKEKIQESLMGFLDSRKVLSLRMGRLDVRFHDPWSLKGWVIDQLSSDAEIRALSFPLERPLAKNTHTKVLRSLGYRILADINKVSVVMPTSLVGTILLTCSERGLSMNQLSRRIDWLITKVHEAGGRIGTLTTNYNSGSDPHFKDPEAVILNALRVLGTDLVGVEEKGLLETTYYPKDAFRLSYYRNQVIHLFISEAIGSIAIFTQIRRTGNVIVSKAAVHSQVQFLSTLLAGEFVFKPDGLDNNINDTLSSLHRQGILTAHDEASDIVEMSNAEMIREGEVFDFYCYLLWPFIDGYWTASITLFALAPYKRVPANLFYNMAQTLAKTLYHEGVIAHYEAVNKEMLKDAFQYFEQQGILIRHVDENRKADVSLAQEWIPKVDSKGHFIPSGKLYEFSEAIAMSRNRPLRHSLIPGMTSRVFELLREVGQKLEVAKL